MREIRFVSGVSAVDMTAVSGVLDTDDWRRWADDALLKGC